MLKCIAGGLHSNCGEVDYDCPVDFIKKKKKVLQKAKNKIEARDSLYSFSPNKKGSP